MLSTLSFDFIGDLPLARASCGNSDSTRYNAFLCDALASDFQWPDHCTDVISSLNDAARGNIQEVVWCGNAYCLTYRAGLVEFENVLTEESGFSAPIQEVIFALSSWRVFLADRKPATFAYAPPPAAEP